jgi:acetyl esterase
LGQTAFPPAHTQTAEQIRDNLRQAVAGFDGPDYIAEPVGHVEDVLVDGSESHIPVRVYTPHGEDPRAVIVYFHGGGFIAGDVDTHDKVTRRLCVGAASTVVAVDYRLAPEFPFPAALNDCFDATAWAVERYADLPVAVAGDSAGATLATCVAQRAQAEGGPPIDAQVLVYPAIELDLDSPSMRQFATGYLLTRADCVAYRDLYLPDAERRSAPYALPGTSASLRGLPPAIIATAGFDPLLSEDEAYVERLRAGGVPVVYQPHPTLIHGWLDAVNAVPAAAAALDELVDAVSTLLDQIRTSA